MVTSYLRLKGTRTDAMARYGRWLGAPEIEPARLVHDHESVDASLHNDEWRGLAVYIYEAGNWTVFEEISGGLGDRSAESWLALADGGDLIYAGYNDASGYAELVCIAGGKLIRHFLDDQEDPAAGIDIGKLPHEDRNPLEDWTAVAEWVERNEDEFFPGSEQGWLWIHEVSHEM
ncbi:MAG TPA: hypothetical protein VJU15_13705 [Gemmatimonadales bacterium]|nr:hypothetical protein [Gemmatimonadales bacterium]